MRAIEDCVDLLGYLDADNYEELLEKEQKLLTDYSNCLTEAISHAK